MSYQRQDLGIPPVVTPQYERIVGGASTSVTLSGLEPGTTYRIRVWSTDGTSVSIEAREMDVTTVESGEEELQHQPECTCIAVLKLLCQTMHIFTQVYTLHILLVSQASPCLHDLAIRDVKIGVGVQD